MSRLDAHSSALGLLAGGGLFAFYLTVVTLGSGWEQATRQLRDDAPLLLPVFPLFGTQIGLYAHLRSLLRERSVATLATGASGGMSGTGWSLAVPTSCPASSPSWA